jgi:hypothetical protein
VLYTNLGNNDCTDLELQLRKMGSLLENAQIVKLVHRNGEEELNHHSIKEFMGSEHLPFKNLEMNGASYSLMVINHSLMEAFRYDIASDIIPKR